MQSLRVRAEGELKILIRDIIEEILSFFKSRLLPMIVIFIVLFFVLINRLFSLQIINGQSYVENVSKSIEKTTSIAATRGRIFDKNGVLLAYNELAYSVKISDSGSYATNEIKNATINETINKTINLIESNGDKITNDFPITVDENGEYQFTVSDMALSRFLRDTYGAKSISALTDEQKNATAKQVVEYLSTDKTYGYGVSSEYSVQNRLEIINLRRSMSANSYNRYLSFTIAYEASDKTVAAILENSGQLAGVVVEEEYVRRYVDSVYISNILGYTGTVSSSDLEDNEKYEANDVVGKAGIEQTLDADLQGTKGSKTVYVDTVGRITEVLDKTEPATGNDVYLTIDINLQKKVYNEIENKLADILSANITTADGIETLVVPGTGIDEGTTSGWTIPIKKVYFALINNNIISLNKIAAQSSTVEGDVYNSFLRKQSEVIPAINEELTTNTPTIYTKLSTENQEYFTYIEKMLKDNGIINKDSIDYNDDTYKNWAAGAISLEEYLTYAISKNWIDMSKLTSEQYSSLREGYTSLTEYIVNKIQSDVGFQKLIYKSLVSSGAVTGRQICMMLFDQGVLAPNDADYASLNSGKTGAYDFMMLKIKNKEITPAQLALEPCSGSCVITNPNTGDVLALVSYPGYDNNKLSGTVDADYYNQLNSDLSLPLLDKATAVQTAPGSIYKLCSAIAGLEEGVITPSQTIYCSGSFDLVTPSPKCWKASGHGSETVATAIRDSCNVFFYNVGYRLALEPGQKYNSIKGTSTLQKYAEQLGLATKSNIEIYEKEPQASNTSAFASAIGQGTNDFSCLNLARYVSTVSTSGICHNFTLVDKVSDSQGTVIRDNSAEVVNTMEVSDSTWTAVHTGMKMVIDFQAPFNGFPISVAGKSGTAQENSNFPDHATFVSYAPYDDPQVAMAVVIPHGYKSANVSALTAEIYKIYYGLK